jgi:hypothetical protein
MLFFARVVPVVLLATLFCCLVGLTCSAFIASTARGDGQRVPDRRGRVRPAAVRVAGGGEQLAPRAAAYLAYVSPLVVALNELPGGWEPVRDHYALHLWTIGAACAAMLAVAWVRLNVLLRQG